MVKRRTSMKVFLFARVFVACCTLVTLTATIMYRPDHDGYQGTHLFFMPRKNWEMDEGRGMLYEEEHYRRADLYTAAAELYGEERLEGFEVEADSEREESYKEYEEEYEEYREDYSTSGSEEIAGPAFRKAPHHPNLSGNEIPLAYGLVIKIPDTEQFLTIERKVMRPTIWRGKTPTPPPRTRYQA